MLNIIRGDSLNYTCEYRDDCNRLIDLTDAEITAFVETPDQSFSHNLIITKLDQNINKGKFIIDGDTSSWPIGQLLLRTSRTQYGKKSTVSTKLKVCA